MTAIKRIALATIALAVALALATVNPASALAGPAHPAVPIKTTSTGPLTIKKDGTFTGEESGVGSQLGKFTMQEQGTGSLDGTTIKGQGTLTVFTANGDQLTGTFETTGDLAKQLTSEVTITGGTGRFAHATGTITVICITVGTRQVDETLIIERECTGTGELRF